MNVNANPGLRRVIHNYGYLIKSKWQKTSSSYQWPLESYKSDALKHI